MSEIKPVFYVDSTTLRCRTMDDVSDESVLYYRRGDKVHDTDVALYPESAIEALQKENAELKHINLTSLADLHFKNRELEARNSELGAARIAYANEFPLNSEGEPDVESIHQNIRKLKADCAKLLSEQDYQYNKQTNELIARHAEQLDVAAEFCRQYQMESKSLSIENKQLRESTADCYEKNLNLNLENFELKVQLTALEQSLEDLQDKYEDVTSQEHSIPELRGQLLESFAEKQKVLCCVERLTLSVANTVKERDELMRKNNHLQFLLDSVILEWCPDEMTEEQMENWQKAQRKIDTADPLYYKLDTYKNNVKFSVDMIK